MPKTLEFVVEIADDLPETVAQNAARGIPGVVSEVVANSYDADATLVHLNYDEESFSVQDNGLGMNKNGLMSFFRVGGSSKKSDPYTPSGRRKLGSHGVAASGLKRLAERCEIETVSNGTCISVNYVFPETLKRGIKIPATVRDANGDSHGTKLTFKGLKFSTATGTTVDDIVQQLTWELPLDLAHNFKVMYNGKELIPKTAENARRFDIDVKGDKCGPVSGEIFLTSRPMRHYGAYVRVDGRVIGDPKTFLELHRLNPSLAKRLNLQVVANEMRSFTNLSRSDFGESLARRELQKILETALQPVFKYADQHAKHTKGHNLSYKRDLVLAQVFRQFEALKLPELKGLRFAFRSFSEDEGPVKIHRNEELLAVNSNYPSTNPNVATSSEALRRGLENAIAEEIAMFKTIARGPTLYLHTLKAERLEILRKIHKKQFVQPTRMDIFPTALYEPAEIPDLWESVDLRSVRYLLEKKVLRQREKFVFGSEVLKLREQYAAFSALPLAMVNAELHTSDQAIERFEKIFEECTLDLSPFVVYCGAGDKRAYFVNFAIEVPFLKETNKVDFRRREGDMAAPVRNFINGVYHPAQIAELTGWAQGEVVKIIDFGRTEIGDTTLNGQKVPLRSYVVALNRWSQSEQAD